MAQLYYLEITNLEKAMLYVIEDYQRADFWLHHPLAENITRKQYEDICLEIVSTNQISKEAFQLRSKINN